MSNPVSQLRLALPASFVVGALMTVQTAINSRLATELGEGPRAGVLAAVFSFGTGLLVLTTLLAVRPSWQQHRHRLRDAVRTGRLPRWQLYGGVLGALIVAAQGLTVGTIGVALFTVAVVAGSTGAALSVDHVGLGPAGRTRISPSRVLGALLTLAAVMVTTGLLSGFVPSAMVVALTALPLVAGAGTAVQQAINAHVATQSSPWVATWNNFLVGFCALVVAFVFTLALPGRLVGVPTNPVLYFGGVLGILFIATASVVVRQVGVLVFGLASVAGQVLSALAIDIVLVPQQVTASTYVGAALTLIGVGVTAWARATTRPR